MKARAGQGVITVAILVLSSACGTDARPAATSPAAASQTAMSTETSQQSTTPKPAIPVTATPETSTPAPPTRSASPLPDAVTAILNDPNSGLHLQPLPTDHVATIDEQTAVTSVLQYMNATGPVVYVSHGMLRGPPHQSQFLWLVVVDARGSAPYPVGPKPLPGEQRKWVVDEYAVAMVSDQTGEVAALQTTMREVPPPSVEPTQSTVLGVSDAFWDLLTDQPVDIFREYEYGSLAEMTRDADLVVLGRLTDIYIAEIWKGAPDDPGNPFIYGRIAIDEVLKGKPASRQVGSVEKQLFDTSFGWQPPDADTIPHEQSVFFLKFEPKYRKETGQPPRNTEVSPFAYWSPTPDSILRNIGGQVRLIEPDLLADYYGADYYALDLEGTAFDQLVADIRAAVTP